MLDATVLKNAVKVNQVWVSEDGIRYTIASNKVETKKVPSGAWPHGYSVARITDVNVVAYTFDLSIEEANGNVDGKKCHWVNMWTEKFIEKFTKA